MATKLEKTAELNVDNTGTNEELDSMREAHHILVDSLKLQIETLEKELEQIRSIR